MVAQNSHMHTDLLLVPIFTLSCYISVYICSVKTICTWQHANLTPIMKSVLKYIVYIYGIAWRSNFNVCIGRLRKGNHIISCISLMQCHLHIVYTSYLFPPACPATSDRGNLAWIIPVAVVAGLLVLGGIILLIALLIVCISVSAV